jgi:hypothetical protein
MGKEMDALTLLDRNLTPRHIFASCCYWHGSIRLQPRDPDYKLRSLPSDPVFPLLPFFFQNNCGCFKVDCLVAEFYGS